MINIGKIVAPFGIKGELKVYPYTNDADMFFDFNEVYIKSKEDFLLKKITSIRKHKNIILIKIENISSIEESMPLIEKEIYVNEDSLPDLSEGENYVYQLISCQVYDEDGKYIGIINDVFNSGAHDIYSVVSEDNNEILIPIIPGTVIDKDIVNKKIVVKILPGLLDWWK